MLIRSLLARSIAVLGGLTVWGTSIWASPEACRNSKDDLASWTAFMQRQLRIHDPMNAARMGRLAADIIYGNESAFIRDSSGTDPNAPFKTLAGNMSMLELAAAGCQIRIAGLLVESGASADGNGGSTPLVVAAARDDVELLEFLVGHGARLDKVDRNGTTALEAAVRGRGLASTKVLLSHGADPNQRLPNGGTLLDLVGHSAEPEDRAVADELKKRGAVYGKVADRR